MENSGMDALVENETLKGYWEHLVSYLPRT